MKVFWVLALGLSLRIWAVEPFQTPTGIAVDTVWKRAVYDFAVKNVRHPAWGISHSERDYQVTLEIAAREKIDLDLDVLFAAAFLHDVGGLPPFSKKGVDHAVRSAEVVEPLLRDWGFPMSKWPRVKEMIVGHVYYEPASGGAAARVFRDADVLDFLGAVGAARILAVTQDPERPDPVLKPSVDTLRDFERSMPGKCTFQSCRDLARVRRSELADFLSHLDQESFGGKAL